MKNGSIVALGTALIHQVLKESNKKAREEKVRPKPPPPLPYQTGLIVCILIPRIWLAWTYLSNT